MVRGTCCCEMSRRRVSCLLLTLLIMLVANVELLAVGAASSASNSGIQTVLSRSLPALLPGDVKVNVTQLTFGFSSFCRTERCKFLLRVCIAPDLDNDCKLKQFIALCRHGHTPLSKDSIITGPGWKNEQWRFTSHTPERSSISWLEMTLPMLKPLNNETNHQLVAVLFDITAVTNSISDTKAFNGSSMPIVKQIISPVVTEQTEVVANCSMRPQRYGGHRTLTFEKAKSQGNATACLKFTTKTKCRTHFSGRGCAIYNGYDSGKLRSEVIANVCTSLDFGKTRRQAIQLAWKCHDHGGKSMEVAIKSVADTINTTIFCAVPGVWSQWSQESAIKVIKDHDDLWSPSLLANLSKKTRHCLRITNGAPDVECSHPVLQCSGSPVKYLATFRDRSPRVFQFAPRRSWQCEGHSDTLYKQDDERDWEKKCPTGTRVCVAVPREPGVWLLPESFESHFIQECNVGEVQTIAEVRQCPATAEKDVCAAESRSPHRPRGKETLSNTAKIAFGAIGFVVACLICLIIFGVCVYRRQKRKNAELVDAQERLLNNVQVLSRTMSNTASSSSSQRRAPRKSRIMGIVKHSRFGSEFYSSSSNRTSKSSSFNGGSGGAGGGGASGTGGGGGGSTWRLGAKRRCSSLIQSDDAADFGRSVEYHRSSSLVTVAGSLALPAAAGRKRSATVTPTSSGAAGLGANGVHESDAGPVLRGYSAYSPPDIAVRNVRVPGEGAEDERTSNGGDLLSPLSACVPTVTGGRPNVKSASADHTNVTSSSAAAAGAGLALGRRSPLDKQLVCSESACEGTQVRDNGHRRRAKDELYTRVMGSQRHSAAALRKSNIIMM